MHEAFKEVKSAYNILNISQLLQFCTVVARYQISGSLRTKFVLMSAMKGSELRTRRNCGIAVVPRGFYWDFCEPIVCRRIKAETAGAVF